MWKPSLVLVHVVALLHLLQVTRALVPSWWFPTQNNGAQQQQQLQRQGRPAQRLGAVTAVNDNNNDSNNDNDDDEINLLPLKDVVLFGIGDLRTDDHGGLARVLQQQQQSNQKGTTTAMAALCVLDAASLTNMPGMVAHTADTVQILLAALDDLAQDLRQAYHVPLRIVVPRSTVNVVDVVQELATENSSNDNGNDNDNALRVHVQDLGAADNQMGYGPWAQLESRQQELADKNNIVLQPWTCRLRQEPWENVANVPSVYTEYRNQYAKAARPQEPLDTTVSTSLKSVELTAPLGSIFEYNECLDAEKLLQRVTQLLSLEEERVQAQANTGLYMTHWGGLKPETVGGRAALKVAQAYLGSDVQGNDEAWTRHPLYPGRACQRNGRSLEHASMQWQLRGAGENTPTGDVKEWLQGESLVRWAAAPLLLGTLSPRRLWQLADDNQQAVFFFDPPAKTLVEGREWHNLLAARNIATNAMYNGVESSSKTSYKYWRYHGFLCRYAVTEMEPIKEETKRQGILLVHGFGASGAQWNKAMDALSTEHVFCQGLAPDLLGFGEAEKPAISYTAYLWDAMVCDFIKERALITHGWESFVLGGNSIGGFTSMSTAASDCAPIKEEKGRLTVTSSGAPGTGKCSGLVLMNSAGPLQNKQEVDAMLNQSVNTLERASVAQITALDALPPCSPPPRPVARTFGNALLTYLRPNIQSICKNLYPTNPSAVDDNLCRGILRDSLDPGAINVMMAGAKLPSPRSANELLQADFRMGQLSEVEESSVHESSFDGPVLVAQGILDPLNDAMDRMKRFGALRSGITMSPIQAGHCPHDELPDQVAQSIARWAVTLVRTESRVGAPN